MRRLISRSACDLGGSADFQSAVSPNFIRRGNDESEEHNSFARLADFKSAIRQSATLRYDRMLHRVGPAGALVANGGRAPLAPAAAASSSASVGKRSKVRATFLPRRCLSAKSSSAVQSSAVNSWPCFA